MLGGAQNQNKNTGSRRCFARDPTTTATPTLRGASIGVVDDWSDVCPMDRKKGTEAWHLFQRSVGSVIPKSSKDTEETWKHYIYIYLSLI